jgi:hypothetical protein
MANEKAEGLIVLPTDGKGPMELATIILEKVAWLASD